MTHGTPRTDRDEAGARALAPGTRRRRRPWWGPVTLATTVLMTLCACTSADGGAEPTPSTGSSSPATPTPSSTTQPATIVVPVYYSVDTGTDLRLVRELRTLPDAGGAALTAARAVLTRAPLDPDYFALWNPAGEVLAVRETGGEIEVDLSTAATVTTTGSAGAVLAVQALVYSVTGALQSDAPVRLLVEGSRVDELFGVLDTRAPIARDDPVNVRLLVQLDKPNQGDVVGRSVTVTGEAAVFEANLSWQVLGPGGAVVQSGTTMTAEGQRFAPFSFTVTLDPGEYVVVITEDDPSDGAGRPPESDSRAFTVR